MLKLTYNEQKALKEFKTALQKKFGPRLVLLQLFGSKARGDFHQDSDLDVLVVLKNMNKKDKYFIYDLVFEISIKFDVYLSEINFDEKKWRQLQIDRFSLARNIEEEGIKV